jgi:hypothetical protein
MQCLAPIVFTRLAHNLFNGILLRTGTGNCLSEVKITFNLHENSCIPEKIL